MDRSRVAVALVMVMALGVTPLARDWCVSSCVEAHRAGAIVAGGVTSTVTRDVTSDPVCHRESPATARLNQVPHPCGHDQGALPNLIADRSASSLMQRFAPVVLSTTPSIAVEDAHFAYAECGHGPPPESIPLALSFSLRI